MKPFDGMVAAHQIRMQLSGIACDRQLTKEESILHNTVMRFLTRYYVINDEHLRVSNEEEPKRLPDPGNEEIPPGEETGLLPTN